MTSCFLTTIAWVGYFAIVIVSLVPGSARPHIPGFPGELEHFLAYGATGSTYGLADINDGSRCRSPCQIVQEPPCLKVSNRLFRAVRLN